MLGRVLYFRAMTKRYTRRDDQWERIKNLLPGRFGDFRVVHLRHSRWSRTGVWQRIFEALAQDADNEYCMIDSTIVKTHQHTAGSKKRGLINARQSSAAVAA